MGLDGPVVTLQQALFLLLLLRVSGRTPSNARLAKLENVPIARQQSLGS